jgi:hypothetical protein
MSDHPTFEKTYSKYEFSELVRLEKPSRCEVAHNLR